MTQILHSIITPVGRPLFAASQVWNSWNPEPSYFISSLFYWGAKTNAWFPSSYSSNTIYTPRLPEWSADDPTLAASCGDRPHQHELDGISHGHLCLVGKLSDSDWVLVDHIMLEKGLHSETDSRTKQCRKFSSCIRLDTLFPWLTTRRQMSTWATCHWEVVQFAICFSWFFLGLLFDLESEGSMFLWTIGCYSA